MIEIIDFFFGQQVRELKYCARSSSFTSSPLLRVLLDGAVVAPRPHVREAERLVVRRHVSFFCAVLSSHPPCSPDGDHHPAGGHQVPRAVSPLLALHVLLLRLRLPSFSPPSSARFSKPWTRTPGVLVVEGRLVAGCCRGGIARRHGGRRARTAAAVKGGAGDLSFPNRGPGSSSSTATTLSSADTSVRTARAPLYAAREEAAAPSAPSARTTDHDARSERPTSNARWRSFHFHSTRSQLIFTSGSRSGTAQDFSTTRCSALWPWPWAGARSSTRCLPL